MGKDIEQAYAKAAEAIKTAILQGQYEAAKGVNRIQLATYFVVGKFVSANTRHGVWGLGALSAISEKLQRLLPGLRGFSAESLKKMRQFYEGWQMLDSNLVFVNTEFQNTVFTNTETSNNSTKSSIANDSLQVEPIRLWGAISLFLAINITWKCITTISFPTFCSSTVSLTPWW